MTESSGCAFSLVSCALKLLGPRSLLPHTESASLAVSRACAALVCTVSEFCDALWLLARELPHNSSIITARELCISGAALSCHETTLPSSLQIKALEATVARLLCDAASRQEAAAVAGERLAAGTETLRMEVAAQRKVLEQQVRVTICGNGRLPCVLHHPAHRMPARSRFMSSTGSFFEAQF